MPSNAINLDSDERGGDGAPLVAACYGEC